jgi:four helix bundle protein
MHDFTKLRVWNWAMDLTVKVYQLTKKFPKQEMYGLTSQLRRSSVSVPSNIAEGAYRNSNKEFNYFLGISNGSVGEVYTQVELARRLEYISNDEATPILEEVMSTKRMISSLQKSL